jgi:hypothetical protein
MVFDIRDFTFSRQNHMLVTEASTLECKGFRATREIAVRGARRVVAYSLMRAPKDNDGDLMYYDYRPLGDPSLPSLRVYND